MSENRTAGKSRVITVRVRHEEHERWKAYAEASGLKFNRWIRTVVNDATTSQEVRLERAIHEAVMRRVGESLSSPTPAPQPSPSFWRVLQRFFSLR